MSRRDGATVVWHEVPGTAPPQKSRPAGYGVIRAVCTDSKIEVTKFQLPWRIFSVGISQVQETVYYLEQQLEHHRTRTFQEEYLAFLKKHGTYFDEKYLWD